jgi:hypothetical protein
VRAVLPEVGRCTYEFEICSCEDVMTGPVSSREGSSCRCSVSNVGIRLSDTAGELYPVCGSRIDDAMLTLFN